MSALFKKLTAFFIASLLNCFIAILFCPPALAQSLGINMAGELTLEQAKSFIDQGLDFTFMAGPESGNFIQEIVAYNDSKGGNHVQITIRDRSDTRDFVRADQWNNTFKNLNVKYAPILYIENEPETWSSENPQTIAQRSTAVNYYMYQISRESGNWGQKFLFGSPMYNVTFPTFQQYTQLIKNAYNAIPDPAKPAHFLDIFNVYNYNAYAFYNNGQISSNLLLNGLGYRSILTDPSFWGYSKGMTMPVYAPEFGVVDAAERDRAGHVTYPPELIKTFLSLALGSDGLWAKDPNFLGATILYKIPEEGPPPGRDWLFPIHFDQFLVELTKALAKHPTIPLTPEELAKLYKDWIYQLEDLEDWEIAPPPAPAGTCVAGSGWPPAGDLRPQPCTNCTTKVSKAVDSCLDTAIVKTEGKYKLDALKECQTDRYGVWDWQTQFTLNTEKTLVPFVGYRDIADGYTNQQKYLADYFEGVALYDGKTPKTNKEYQEMVTRAGVWRKLAPQAVQDEYKIQMIKKSFVLGYNYTVSDGEGNTLKMQDWTTCNWDPTNPLTVNCHLPPQREHPQYLELRAAWDKTIWGRLWPYVPMFTREDTPGKIVAEIENPPGELQKTTPEAQQVSQTKVEFPVTFPHIKRLYEVTQALQKLLLPKVVENQSLAYSSSEPRNYSGSGAAAADDSPGVKELASAGQVLAATTAKANFLAQATSEFVEDDCGLFIEKDGFVKYYNNHRNTCGTIADFQLTVEYDIDQTGYQTACHTDILSGELFPQALDGRYWPRNISDNDLGAGGHCGALGGQSVTQAAQSSFMVRITTSGGRGTCQQTITREARVIKDENGNWIAQGCGSVEKPAEKPKDCGNLDTFSPLACLESSIKDPNPKLDPACCSDTANVVVNDYWRFLKTSGQWCEDLRNKCCNDEDPAERAECKNNICSHPGIGDCPWETTPLYRKVRFDVQIPYLKKIWQQIAGVADNLEELSKKTGIFTVFKPAAFPRYAEKYARSEINYDLTSQPQVKGKTPDYGPEAAPGEISPQKADFYFPYLGGAELTKQWFVDSLRPKELQEGKEKPF